MKQYKQPKTRIKEVRDGWGVIYYAQYQLVFIPHVLWEWNNITGNLGDKEYVGTMYEAKLRVDDFLEREHRWWALDIEEKAKKRVKKKVKYIDYP